MVVFDPRQTAERVCARFGSAEPIGVRKKREALAFNASDPLRNETRRVERKRAAWVSAAAQSPARCLDQLQSWQWSRPGHLPCLRALQRVRSPASLKNVAKNEGSCRTTTGVAQPGWKSNGLNMTCAFLDWLPPI
jgi:hypothetical protein